MCVAAHTQDGTCPPTAIAARIDCPNSHLNSFSITPCCCGGGWLVYRPELRGAEDAAPKAVRIFCSTAAFGDPAGVGTRGGRRCGRYRPALDAVQRLLIAPSARRECSTLFSGTGQPPLSLQLGDDCHEPSRAHCDRQMRVAELLVRVRRLDKFDHAHPRWPRKRQASPSDVPARLTRSTP